MSDHVLSDDELRDLGVPIDAPPPWRPTLDAERLTGIAEVADRLTTALGILVGGYLRELVAEVRTLRARVRQLEAALCEAAAKGEPR